MCLRYENKSVTKSRTKHGLLEVRNVDITWCLPTLLTRSSAQQGKTYPIKQVLPLGTEIPLTSKYVQTITTLHIDFMVTIHVCKSIAQKGMERHLLAAWLTWIWDRTHDLWAQTLFQDWRTEKKSLWTPWAMSAYRSRFQSYWHSERSDPLMALLNHETACKSTVTYKEHSGPVNALWKTLKTSIKFIFKIIQLNNFFRK